MKRTIHSDNKKAFTLWFEEVGIEDVPVVGGKNASLGEMIQQLTQKGVNVPGGFATTAHAYREFIKLSGLESKLRQIFKGLDVHDTKQLASVGRNARELILSSPFPPQLEEEILKGYNELCKRYNDSENSTDVAVRSSATAEDLPDASFAGQQETYLNVRGTDSLLESCHKCFASIFTDRAISYRTLKGFDHLSVALSVGIQKMIRSDLASAGVVFSIDTETGFKDVVLITGSYGLGENVVQGSVNPDEFFVFKPTLSQGYEPIVDRRLGSKLLKMIYESGGTKLTRNVPVSWIDQQHFCLSDSEVIKLAKWAVIIEEHYSKKRNKWTPMDIEWAKDGISGQLFIVQARPETVQSQKVTNIYQSYQLNGKGKILTTGRAVGSMIGQGKASVIKEVKDMNQFVANTVLITHRTDPDWEPIMKKASAIVTNQGGRTCHAAIIARELGIPAIVGCGDATKKIPHGQEVTISCAEGEEGIAYEGLIPFQINKTELNTLPSTKTQILMNIGNPQEAFKLSSLPCDGVGLARLEFIIANFIKIHPLSLVHFNDLKDQIVKHQIEEITCNYGYKPDYFVDRLASGIGMIASAFFPKPVVVRLSDFKSNEYANLLGGKEFEPKEENPMIGWRGASRYYDPKYRDGFALECAAFKKVREVMGLKNVIPMVPFCRTVQEGEKVLEEMKKNGLERGKDGLQVYVMCEIPSNVILAEKFSKIFDGFSIGSNDLTQLTLGLDRDSNLVAHIFDERNEAVKYLVSNVIHAAKANNRKIGICGQAPSDYPEFAKFLVQEGIDSISLSPDTIIKTRLDIAQVEESKKKK